MADGKTIFCQSCEVYCFPKHEISICSTCRDGCKECIFSEMRGGKEAPSKEEKQNFTCRNCKTVCRTSKEESVQCDGYCIWNRYRCGKDNICIKCPPDCRECHFPEQTAWDTFKNIDPDPSDPDYSMDDTRPDLPDRAKFTDEDVQGMIHRFNFMFSAYCLKIKAAIARLGQTKKLRPKCTEEEIFEMNHRRYQYCHEYQKENFLRASKKKIYYTKFMIAHSKEELKECCNCRKLEPAPFSRITNTINEYLRELGSIWHDFEHVDTFARLNGFKTELPFTLKDIHRKLYDESLSKRDLDAILDSILKDDKAKKTEKTVSKNGRQMEFTRSLSEKFKMGRMKNKEKKEGGRPECQLCYTDPVTVPLIHKPKLKKGNALRNALRFTTKEDLNNLGA